jgi:PAS domain S-box-containing protein
MTPDKEAVAPERDRGTGSGSGLNHTLGGRVPPPESLRPKVDLLGEIEAVAKVGIWTWDPSEPNAWWSPQLYQIYGLDPKTHTPTYPDYLTRVHPDDRERVQKATEAVFKDAKPYSHDERIFRPDGSIRHLHTWAHALLDDAGRLVKLVGICQDITDRKEAELVQERLAAIVASSEDAIIGQDLAGRITSWNPSAARIFGYSEAEALGTSIDFLIPQEEKPQDDELRARVRRGERVEYQHTRRRCKDGSLVDVSMSVSPIRDSSGKIVGVSKIVRDLSQQRTSEEGFRQLLEASPDALVVVDASGAIMRVNREAERLFGYAREELVGQRVEVLVPDAARQVHAGHRERYMEDPRLRPMGVGRDLKARRKDGSEFPVEISLNPLKTPRGVIVVSAIRDITERKRVAQEREELERLRAMNQFKSQFINMAAHELNTPLTPIRLQLHMLKEGSLGPLSELQRKSAEILDRNLERVTHLVQNMLDVGRIQSGRIELRKTRIDMARAVEEAVEAFEDVANQAGVHLASRTTGDFWVDADPQRVQQVLFNLLSNAIRFTPPEGNVSVVVEGEPQQVVVHVHDTGIGLIPEQIDRLFQPFSQVHPRVQTAGQPGTGLGLFISKQLVELHGGTLSVQSAGRDQGSTFTFTLPQRPRPGRPAPPQVELASRPA